MVILYARVYPVASVISHSFLPYGLQLVRLLCPWESPGKSTRVGCHALLQEIFPAQGSSLHLLLCQVDSLPTEPPGKPLILHSRVFFVFFFSFVNIFLGYPIFCNPNDLFAKKTLENTNDSTNLMTYHIPGPYNYKYKNKSGSTESLPA